MSAAPELYTAISSFEPLLPGSLRSELAELSCQVLHSAGQLTSLLPSPIIRQKIANVIREMNSYYSNLIEGHKTYPREIESALKQNYASDPIKRGNQHFARAHIEVEALMLDRLETEPDLSIHHPEFIQWLHREFYERLPEDLQMGLHANGQSYPIQIGQWRSFEVTVGGHQPPQHSSIPAFMARFHEFYGSQRIIATNQLIAAAAAHHRLAWVHPFGDGNGRVTRLHTHALLTQSKVGGLGLWTMSRGLARQQQEYYDRLMAADRTRSGDLDGRGNLSDRGLADFCIFFLKTMLDQINFMTTLLDLHSLMRRMEAHLHVAHFDWSTAQREQVSRLLKAALIDGQVERGAVPLIIGRKVTSASAIIKLALEAGLIESPNAVKGTLSLRFSSSTLESYFPQLYQDLPVLAG